MANHHSLLVAYTSSSSDTPQTIWKCADCGETGTMKELQKQECSVLPPCLVCGQSPNCVRGCPGDSILRAQIQQYDIPFRVAGSTEP